MSTDQNQTSHHAAGIQAEAELETQLRHKLQRQNAPPGFAARVMAEAESRQVLQRRKAAILHMPVLRWAGIAAVLAVSIASIQHHEQQRRYEGEAARKQVLLALHITSSKLHRMQTQLHRGTD